MLKYLIISLLTLPTVTFASVKVPKTPLSLSEVTVMISDKSKKSGGSGVIFRSGESSSLILTNSHVCEGFERGGVVTASTGEYAIERFKRSKEHDICMVQVIANLGVSTRLADKSPSFGDEIRISGHPNLLPVMTTVGHSSKNLEITMLVGQEKCSDEEVESNPFLCIFFGGMPVIKNYTAMSSSVMIAPGNSGSGVFNSRGEIVGLAFAGVGRGISHGLIVPLDHIRRFTSVEYPKLKWTEANSSRRWSDSSKKNTTMTSTFRLTKENINLVTFPAIKNTKTEHLVEKIDLCRKGVENCQLK